MASFYALSSPPIPASDEDETDLNAANEQIVEEVSLVDVDIDAERARQRAEHRTHQVCICVLVCVYACVCLIRGVSLFCLFIFYSYCIFVCYF